MFLLTIVFYSFIGFQNVPINHDTSIRTLVSSVIVMILLVIMTFFLILNLLSACTPRRGQLKHSSEIKLDELISYIVIK
jgi:hypothetical protein